MELKGRVGHIMYHNQRNFFTVFKLYPSDANNKLKDVTVSGHFPFIYRSVNLSVFGKWKENKKYGKGFSATSYHIIEPSSSHDLIDFLSSELVGCPWNVAMLISQKIGLEYLKKYNNLDFCLEKLMRSDFIEYLKTNAFRLSDFYRKKDLLEQLSNMGFSQEISSKIAFSENPPSIQKILENPYLLIKRYDLDWKLVDHIALKNGIGMASKVRVHEGIYYLLNIAANQSGHMFIPQPILERTAKKFLNAEINISAELAELEDEKRVTRDIKDHVYSIENYESERRLSENLFRIFSTKPAMKKTSVISYAREKFPYSDDQKEAIDMAIQNQLSIISGPAGTGKTTILVKIVKELKQLGYDVQLCAPTGRAAKRMSEVTNMKSVTIHNLLKFSAETKLPLYNRDFPLTRNCFIIDEASMIDLKIASYLFEAIQSGSKVVIIGDVHQLPSIGPGKMLSDLIECKFFPVKELNQVFRQSGTSYILDFATKVRNGEHLDFGTLPSKSDFKFAEMSGLKEIQNAIKQLVQRFVAAGKYDPFEDLQIITPIHAGPIGTKELNSHIQDILNPLKTTEVSYGDRIYRPNDKVIQLSNNPDKELVNGDIGKILRVNAKEKHIVVDFYGRVVDFYDEELFELDLGYVLTVHKIQGGECPFIIMPYHSSFGQFMLNRKLFYTAITRAKRQMLIVGEEEAVKNSIDNNDSDVRYCNLIPRLKSARMDHLFN